MPPGVTRLGAVGEGRGPEPRTKGRIVVVVAVVVALTLIAAAAYVAWPRGTPLPPGPTVPAAPTNVEASAADGRVTVSWDSVADATGYDLYQASVPGVTKEGYGGMADGARYADVASPYTVSGLTNEKTYYFRVTARNAAGESDVSAEVSATPTGAPGAPPMYVTGRVQLDTGAPAVGADVTVRSEDGTAIVQGTTGVDGRFNLALDPSLPTRILAEVTYRGAIGPTATGFRWSPLLASGGAVDVGRILVPDPTNKRIPMVGSSAASPDGAVIVTALPPNVASMWVRSYDPDAVPDIFPGDLAEGRDLPLNSVVFLWISALDAGGAPVVDVNPPATVRLRVPVTQWVDVEDWLPGNGVIDTPVYSFDYGTAYWARETNGLLTDAVGTPIGEAQEPAIRRGLYAGDIYAEFRAGHFSWWNIDKPPTNCTTDFGDAPDPTYPTLLASDGARHQDICRAWLGAWVDGEADADVPDLDLYDDGLLQSNPISVRVSNWNWTQSLYLNALIDGNADGDWSDSGEWALQNLPVSVPTRKGARIDTDVPWDGKTWLRLTLTGAKITDYNGTGAFAIGETEDYPFVKYRLSVWVAGNGTVTSDPPGINCRKDSGPCSAEYAAGTVVNLTADPDPGESFIGWGGDCSGSNATCSVTMSEARSVYATFTQPYYRLSVYVYGNDPTGNRTGGGNVTSEPPGISCGGWDQGGTTGGNCTAVFPRGTVVNLTATPDPGWSFGGWSGACTGTSPTCTLTMDSDKWVGAYFTKP